MSASAEARVKCPSCGVKYALKPEYAGKKLKCKCGVAFTMPGGPKASKPAVAPASPAVKSTHTKAVAAKPAPAALKKKEACPSCAQPLAAGAVICVNCGFNRATGQAAATEVGRAVKAVGGAKGGRNARRAVTVYHDGFFARFRRSWEFAKISYGIIWDFKRLLVFPIMSGAAALLVAAAFILPLLGTPTLDRWMAVMDSERNGASTGEYEYTEDDAAYAELEEQEAEDTAALAEAGASDVQGDDAVAAMEPVNAGDEAAAEDSAQPAPVEPTADPLMYIYAFAFYFCCFFVIVFFNTALTACAMKVYSGGSPTVAYGLSIAVKRLPAILAWALVSASVGLALKAIENVHEKLGKWIAALIGTAWTVLTYFVVPVLVLEEANPFTAVKKSATTLKKTWGEGVLGNFSLGLFAIVLAIPVYLVVGALLYMGFTTGSTTLMGLAILVAVLSLILLAAANSAADTIFKALLYNFATGGTIPEEVDEDQLSSAFGSPPNA